MLIEQTTLQGAFILQPEPIQDERGFFARTFCQKALADQGVYFNMVQCNIAFNRHPNTLRGMHLQLPPYCEQKIVTCISGEIYDVIIDLNAQSPTYGQWFGLTLSSENRLSLYVPQGFAHGYLTLTENAGISYMVSQFYAPSHEYGVRWDDPAFAIQWPCREGLIISHKDRQWKDFNRTRDGILFRGEDTCE